VVRDLTSEEEERLRAELKGDRAHLRPYLTPYGITGRFTRSAGHSIISVTVLNALRYQRKTHAAADTLVNHRK
jgi:hypothetical protein